MYAAWSRVSAADSPLAYTRTVLLRTFLAQRRLRRVAEYSVGELPERSVRGPDVDSRLALIAAMRRLSPQDRAVLTLRYWEDMSVAETADLLGIRESTCRSRTSRALARLRNLLPDLTLPHHDPGGPLMNDLRQRLHDTFDHEHTDVVLLAERAKSQGARLRRRRRLSVATGSLAVAAVLAAGVASATQLLPGPPEASLVTGFAAQGEATVPVTTRSLTAALQAGVAEVADGTASEFEGFLTYAGAAKVHDPLVDDKERDSYQASFTFAPADGSPGATVSAVLADKAGMDDNKTTAEDNFTTCIEDLDEDCQVTTLPDGSLLKTYVRHSIGSTGQRAYEILTAERMVGDTVVRVEATNGGELTEAGNVVTRPHPTLSVDQLTEIVSQPWWGYDLPQEFADAGADLPGYHESDSIVD